MPEPVQLNINIGLLFRDEDNSETSKDFKSTWTFFGRGDLSNLLLNWSQIVLRVKSTLTTALNLLYT